MSAPRKLSARERLERIEDAMVDSILDAAGTELSDETVASGGDPDALVAEFGAVLASARSRSSQCRLERAREELAAWRAKDKGGTGLEREAARARFERLRSGERDPDSDMMMAARKGKGLSENDAEGVIEDMAELERLERDNDDG